jgi:hypothetical protein
MPRQEPKLSRDAELLQGTLDMLILKTVALEPIHGYGIVQRLHQISKDALQIRQGSLYPALYRLSNKGWLKAEWKTTDGGRGVDPKGETTREATPCRSMISAFDSLVQSFMMPLSAKRRRAMLASTPIEE